MMSTIKANRNITTDVIVIGGGTAGVFAAISAAKCGAKVLLIEKNNVLGGTVTVAEVNFPGLFYAWGKQIINGPCFEAIERTVKLGGAVMPEITYKPKYHWKEQIRVNTFIFSTVLYEMCVECGVIVITNCMLSCVSETKDGVEGVLTDKSGMFQFSALKIIDATGDANVVLQAGYATVKSETLQPATLTNRIYGYDINAVDSEQLRSVITKFGMPDLLDYTKILNCLKFGTLDLHIPCTAAETSIGRTELEIKARCLLLRVYKLLRSVKGLELLNVQFAANETGVRETCRIVGESVITAEDYINGTHYEDSVCYAFYPIDLHTVSPGTVKQIFLKENVVPKVPYTSLIPKNSKHILVAGRCISSDTYANSALRVQAVCMATGQVAGCAAALCAKKRINAKNLPFLVLANALKKIGAIVP